MVKAQSVTYFKGKIEDKVGELLAVTKDLKAKNLGLIGLWGYGTGSGQGELYAIAKNPDKLRTFWKESAMMFEEGIGFILKGTDKTGALVQSLEAIDQAGINIVAFHALAVGGKYITFIRVAQADVDKTGQALGAK